MSNSTRHLDRLAIEHGSTTPVGDIAERRRRLAWLTTPSVAAGNRVVATRPAIVNVVRAVCDPIIIIGLLIAIAHLANVRLEGGHALTALIMFTIVIAGSRPGRAFSRGSTLGAITRSTAALSALLLVAVEMGYLKQFPTGPLVAWAAAAMLLLVISHRVIDRFAPRLAPLQRKARTAVIVGATPSGRELAAQFRDKDEVNTEFVGFFDDRDNHRAGVAEAEVIGRIPDVAPFVQQRRVDVVYIALPMAAQPRILRLLHDLRDTTASVYFVPDIFITDFVQARITDINGIPVLAVCETPFEGVNSLIKRGSDVGLAIVLLILAAPLMLAIAAALKLSRTGPVIFKQRRYGIDGKDIVIYKFRSMTVSEDGEHVPQARRADPRLTPLGAVLRRYSLDELPQLFNVLQGRMSLVGPRPHAVAHNELYRKLIDGYMIRHKVRPGITGLAQVSGCRGETASVDKMRKRVEYDLMYLRNWSLQMDLYIVAKTVLQVWHDPASY